jgi:hypothetical protein
VKIKLENHGSIWLARPLDDAADDLLAEWLESSQFFGKALVIEPRYVEGFVALVQERGGEVL